MPDRKKAKSLTLQTVEALEKDHEDRISRLERVIGVDLEEREKGARMARKELSYR